MGLLQPLGQGQGHLKAGFLGFAGSGKTYTSTHLLIGLRKFMNLEGPIVMFDTEGGSEYIADLVKEHTGKDLIGIRSMAFADLLEVVKEAEQMGAAGLLVDSITHIWREVQDSHLAKVNEIRKRKRLPRRFSLEFQDWGPIKTKWAEWTNVYLNSPLNIVICGRAGYDYDYDVNEETGKKELQKTGIKMKAENEFGFEPSLLVEMARVQEMGTKRKIIHKATILKDRYGLIDGREFNNPTFKTFLPHIRKLVPGAHATIDTSLKTQPLIDGDGVDYGRKRTILLDEIKEELLRKWPSTSKDDKAAKGDLLEEVFGTRSWERVSSFGVNQLQDGLAAVRAITNPKPVEPNSEKLPSRRAILVDEYTGKLRALGDVGFNEENMLQLAGVNNWNELQNSSEDDLEKRIQALATLKLPGSIPMEMRS